MKSIALNEKEIARFWNKVKTGNKDVCWEWMAARNEKGYGIINIRYKTVIATRVVWTIVNGEIPDGIFVLHKCDNPPCCNPEHLFLGTIRDNAIDMASKGRSRKGKKFWFRGEMVVHSKLKEREVIEIKRMLDNKETCASISRIYGVTPEAINHIKLGKNWGWVEK